MPITFGPIELVVILVIVMLVIGPGKLPELGSALGKGIREFRRGATEPDAAPAQVEGDTKQA